ncbi:MAG: hypothetical protein WC719_01630 [Patescibacteria group bacterium]|jgi:hypothetical protein
MDKEKKIKLVPVFDTFEIALKTWWKNLKKIVLIYLWGLLYALIPMAVIAILLGVNYWLGDSVGLGFRIATVIISVLGFFTALYFFIRSYIGIFLLVKNDYAGHEKKLFKETRQYFWPYVSLVILTCVFVLLWTLLLIIPGIIYSVLYSFACYALFFEDKRGLAAIRRSVQLVSGYFWPVFGRFIFVGVIVWVFSLLISLPLSFAEKGSLFNSIWGAIVQVASLLIGPIVLVYTYSIYKELVKIKK